MAELYSLRAVVCNMSGLLVPGMQHEMEDGKKTAQFVLPIKTSWSNSQFCFWLSWIDFGFPFASLRWGKL